MLYNYILTALRNFRKQSVFTILNLIGLTVGLATSLLIMLYVVNETGYDRQNHFADRIFRVNAHFRIAGEALEEKIVPADLGPAMKRDYPIVQNFVRVRNPGRVTIRRGGEWATEDKACWADSSLFDVFTLPLLAGNPKTALVKPNSVVLSASMAARQFGGQTPAQIMGKTLEMNGHYLYTVTGVMEDMPVSAHFHFDMIASLSTQQDSREVNWINNDWITYLLLKPGVSETQLNKDLAEATQKYASPIIQKVLGTSLSDMAKKGDYYIYNTIPLTRIHLYSDLPRELEPSGSILYVRMFVIVGIFILLLACVNFMNLSTARSARRSREVGIRKTLGSGRGQLIGQFLVESVLFSLGAIVLALAVLWAVLPYFNNLSNLQLTMASLPWNWLLPAAFGGAVLVGVLAGSYPAFVLSAFQPIEVLKGKLTRGMQGRRLRNVLVIFQFTTAVALIMGTLVIYHQLDFIRNKRLGFDRSQVLLIPHLGELQNHILPFKASLEQTQGVQSVTLASSFPTSNFSLADVWYKDAAKTRTFGPEHWNIDADYIPTLKMTVMQGRNFRPDMPSDSQGVIINQTMARLLDFKDPIGQNIYQNQGSKLQPYPIIGVVKDFQSVSMHQKVPPIVMTFDRGDRIMAAVRVSTGDMQSLVKRVRQLYATFAEGSPLPFDYSFMDEDFNAMYRSEGTIGHIFAVFTSLAVLVACLGLFGLVVFSAEQRSKELSIRKVLGATAGDIIVLLARDYVLLILLSLTLAFPLAWWGGQRWLETFTDRTPIDGWTFCLAAGTILLAVALTVSWQAFRSATANPVDNLKAE